MRYLKILIETKKQTPQLEEKNDKIQIKDEKNKNKMDEPEIVLKNAKNLNQSILFIDDSTDVNFLNKTKEKLMKFIGDVLVKSNKEVIIPYFYLVGTYETINDALLEVRLNEQLVFFDKNNEELMQKYEFAVRKLN